jgi:preprotein translocase subunit SecD
VARSANDSRPGRSLTALVVLLALIFGGIALGAATSDGQWTPKLALDLEGGTAMILTPKAQGGKQVKITKDQMSEAVNIIRQRVNGNGVSEAEVTTEGARNIVVSIPGVADAKTRNLVKQSAELTFRPVLVSGPAAPQPAPTPGATPSGPAPTGTAKPSATPSGAAAGTPSAKPSATNSRIVPKALLKAAATPAAQPTGAAVAPTGAVAQNGATANPGASAPAGTIPDPNAAQQPPAASANTAATGTASDLAQITPALQQAFTTQTCSNLESVQSAAQDPAKPIITCDQTGTEKYILGPVEVRGKNIKSATAGLGTNSQGFSTGEWQVQLSFDGTGTKQFAKVTERLASLTGDQNRFAIVLDQLVVSAPTTNERIPTGEAQISGNFTQSTAKQLASQLKFGALPVSFQLNTEDQISALLGGEQLRRGLLAGLIGLILVVAYSLLQYRALGLVTIFSLVIAGAYTYGLVVLLGWSQGFRLSLPGVAGLIVAIGITADSFIVYFERVRDEVREGRPLVSAVEAAWKRARRTILVSDGVSFLAAVVLYFLAVGGVRGFAFTLGLTTLIDVVVVFLFTKPTVTLLARTRFFGGGHRLSGFAPEQLGRVSGYAGRGRVRPPAGTEPSGLGDTPSPAAPGARPASGQSIAARRAAARRSEAGHDPDPTDDPGGSDGSDRVSAGRPNRTRKDV